MADIYVMDKLCFNRGFPNQTVGRKIEPYFYRKTVLVVDGPGYREEKEFDALPDKAIDRLKSLQQKGHRVISGVHLGLEGIIDIEGDLEMFRPIGASASEEKRLTERGVVLLASL